MADIGIYAGGEWATGLTLGGEPVEVWATHPATGEFIRVHPSNPWGTYSGPQRTLTNNEQLRAMTPEQLSAWWSIHEGDRTQVGLLNAVLATSLGDLVGYSDTVSRWTISSAHQTLFYEVVKGYERDYQTEAYRDFKRVLPDVKAAYREGRL